MLSISAIEFSFEDRLTFYVSGWEASPGSCLYLEGINGSGKSTYLRILSQIFECDFSYVGHNIPQEPMAPLSTLQCFFELFQKRILDSQRFSLAQSPAFSQYSVGSISSESVFLSPPQYFYELSAGQQRLFLLKSLLSLSSSLWIIDEGWIHLDASALSILKEYIEAYCAQGGIVLYTDHHKAIALQPTHILSVHKSTKEGAVC
jgi:heme exporter protein A